jgi:hypothetical protein
MLEGAAWTGGRFVAVGAGTRFLVSPTGEAWDTVPAPAPFLNWHSVAWSGRQALATGSGALAVSADGLQWESTSPGSLTPESRLESWYHAHWTGNEWLVPDAWGDVWVSRDGRQWGRWFMDQTQTVYALAGNGRTLVAVGVDGMIMTASEVPASARPARGRDAGKRHPGAAAAGWLISTPAADYRIDGARIKKRESR